MSDPSYRATRRNQGQLLNAAADIRALNELGVLMDMDTYGELLEREPPSKKDARRFIETVIKLSSPFKMMDFALESANGTSALPVSGVPGIYNLFQGIQRGNLCHNNFEGNQIKPLRMTFNMNVRGNNPAAAILRVMVFQWLGPIVSTGSGGLVSSPAYDDVLNYLALGTVFEPLTCGKNWTNNELIKTVFDGLYHLNGYDASATSTQNSKDGFPIVIERELDDKFSNVCWRDSTVSPNYDPYKGAFLALITDNIGASSTRTNFTLSSRIVYYNQ